jgi:uncharacterized LabA/DUF88 family protein
MVNDTKYLFIDGGYLQEIYRTAMEKVFAVAGDLSIQKILHLIAPFRTYYYDCVDDTKKDNESESDFETRVLLQEAHATQIRSLSGVHLRRGTLTGRRRRQKEVDVMLTVDMLTHGFNRNMSRAALLAGDLDFRPLVEASVRGGIFVEVWYEKASGSKKLYWAADQGRPIDWKTLYSWSTDSFIADHPLPQVTAGSGAQYLTAAHIDAGSFDGGTVELLSCTDLGPFVVHVVLPGGNNQWLKHADRDVLHGYLSVIHGAITWKSLRKG